MRQRVATWCPRRQRSRMEEPDLNPGGDPPDDDRNDEVEGSPVPDPTEEAPDGDDIPEAD
jgi:hypothetical protein